MKLFDSPADRDGTITMLFLFVVLVFVLIYFKSSLTASEINFVLGAIMTQIGNVVMHFFKRKEDNGNGKNS